MFRTAFAATAGLMLSAALPALAHQQEEASGEMHEDGMAEEKMSGDAMMEDGESGDAMMSEDMAEESMMEEDMSSDTMMDDEMMMDADEAAFGPAIGQPAPAVNVVTASGEPATLDTLAGENGTAIAFIRSLDWCPYCQKQAKGLEAAKAPLEEAGWSLVALSYDSPETLSGFAEANDLSYTLVSDGDSEVIKAFGLLNEEMREGTRYWGIPHPAIVFIRADGTVAEVLHEDGYKERPEVERVTETAVQLNAGS